MARRYRFFIESADELAADITLSAALQPDIVEQLTKVLRARGGDEVVLVPARQGRAENVRGRAGLTMPHGGPILFEYLYRVAAANKKEVQLTFVDKRENFNELGFGLELVLCLPNKPDKLSFILQKAVELGASRVVLVAADFSQMKHGLRDERLRKIMKEAAEQSERALVPELAMGGALRDYLGVAPEGLLVAMEREDAKSLPELLGGVSRRGDDDAEMGGSSGDFAILVGPEGGFSDAEKSLMRARGFGCFTLGPRILRMETAAIVALGMAAIMPRHPQ